MTGEEKQDDGAIEIELKDLELEHVSGGIILRAYVSSDLSTVTFKLPEPLPQTQKFGFRGQIRRKR
jgi:hypothetical protein